MRRTLGKARVYTVFDEKGNKVAKGTSKELSELYGVDQERISACARGRQRVISRKYPYLVIRGEIETKQEVIERKELIKKLYLQGVSTKHIAEQIGISEGATGKYIRDLKKEGEIT